LNEAPDKNRRLRREILIYFKGFGEGVKSSGRDKHREIWTSENRDIGGSEHRAIWTSGNRGIENICSLKELKDLRNLKIANW